VAVEGDYRLSRKVIYEKDKVENIEEIKENPLKHSKKTKFMCKN
jgi:hypothetical protein